MKTWGKNAVNNLWRRRSGPFLLEVSREDAMWSAAVRWTDHEQHVWIWLGDEKALKRAKSVCDQYAASTLAKWLREERP